MTDSPVGVNLEEVAAAWDCYYGLRAFLLKTKHSCRKALKSRLMPVVALA